MQKWHFSDSNWQPFCFADSFFVFSQLLRNQPKKEKEKKKEGREGERQTKKNKRNTFLFFPLFLFFPFLLFFLFFSFFDPGLRISSEFGVQGLFLEVIIFSNWGRLISNAPYFSPVRDTIIKKWKNGGGDTQKIEGDGIQKMIPARDATQTMYEKIKSKGQKFRLFSCPSQICIFFFRSSSASYFPHLNS